MKKKNIVLYLLVESAAVISPSEDQITQRTSNLYHLFIPWSNLLNIKQIKGLKVLKVTLMARP